MLEDLTAVRVVATPEALDAFTPEDGHVVLRFAPDEALIVGAETADVDDAHAIVERDTGWRGMWVDTSAAVTVLAHTAAWEPPSARPALAQGMVAGVATKVLLGSERTLIAVPRAVSSDLEDRIFSRFLA